MSLSVLPGPEPAPLFGWRANALRFFRDPIGYMDRLFHGGHGSVVALARGGGGPLFIRRASSSVFAFGPRCNQAVLSQMGLYHSVRVEGPPESRAIERLFSGLFDMNDERHREHRRLLQPAFTKARLDSYHAEMVAMTERMVDGWRDGSPRDLLRDMQRLTLDVANKTLFGLAPTPATALPLDLPWTPRRRLVASAARLERSLRDVVAARRAEASPRDDMLSTLLGLTDDELIGHLFLLFLAGHDTTKSALVWTFFLLSQHPDVRDALYDELRGTLHGAAPSVEQLGELPLLDHVFRESLRLFTPAPMAPRMTIAPTELDGHPLPARAEVILSYYHTHRSPEVYPDPHRFLPRRWETCTPSPYEYVPFGAGARTCVGARFATMEAKTVLAIVLQRVRLELVPGARIDRKTTIVMSPRQGMPMIVRPAASVAPRTNDGVRGNVREMVELPGAPSMSRRWSVVR